ncbi:MAG TPA: 4Fe-4S dicluster domain-containing protein [Hyphomicrobiaceae bacterium]|nr:4Fe-4S dicluster domain-containing protein [Hyphomicrobiaceae bacterium]
MTLDTKAIRRACRGGNLTTARQLCRGETDRFRSAIEGEAAVTVACTQETALFDELAEAVGSSTSITYVNIRETAGWSRDGANAGPKMAALLAAAAEPMPSVPVVSLESEGVILIYGRDERAVEAGNLLKEHLDVTVLIKPPADIPPQRNTAFPIARGVIRAAKGHLGAFELTVDDFAQPAPSSRQTLVFGEARNDTRSKCDVILDLTGGTPLLPASELRDGYLRADPDHQAAMLEAVLRARDLVGSFEKPRYVAFDASLCAHSRSRIVGCTRCLDLCPAGAIAPAGNHVAIQPEICAGCGQCAAACPTGAAAYALQPGDALMRKLRALLLAYRDAGGNDAVVLLHDEDHGGALIDALARYGDGLPSHVLPVAVNEVTQVGLDSVAAAFAYGASAVRFLLRARPRHDVTGLRRTLALAEPILWGLGFDGDRTGTIETDDPDALDAALRAIAPMPPAPRPATFLPAGGKRDVLRVALRELHRAAPAPTDVVALPDEAPFGAVEINAAGCTLCLACVSACPTGALTDNPEQPMLRFAEDACVQCGLCGATCPEKVITLKPQLDFRAATAAPRVLKEEKPFCCIRCGKPFGVRSAIERVISKLEGTHWMYKDGASRIDMLRMCDDCRVVVISEQDFDPYGAPPRARVRTTDDYLRERWKNEDDG